MWDFLSPADLIGLQRKAALDYMGEQAQQLLAEGYNVDADRVLDEMLERQQRWQTEGGVA